MTKLPGAKPSPRIAGGVLRWYAGDTFSVAHTFQFDRVTGGQATLTFDDTVSAKFPKGAYFYDILYTHGDKTTLARDNRAAAE